MITRITEKNAQLYRVLFDKAAKKLREAQPPDLNEAVTEYFGSWDNFEIGSLDEYYAYLRNLVDISGQTEEQQAFFVRLPLDEDVFAIDANSRTITVPASFARNGVGVQSDEMAEILYFTIDRYFDAIDLATSDILIAIQWEAKDANKQTIAGFSRNFGKDVESIPGKIIFGWPISHELTQTNSTIKFAVRFYKIEENEQHEKIFRYSFATLPAEITVNATLVYDVTDVELEINHGSDIINRINSDGIHNANMPIPGEPVMTLTDIIEDNKIYAIGYEGLRIVDLPVSGGIDLAASAQPTISNNGSTLGVIGYKWKKYSYAGDGTYNPTFSPLSNTSVSVDYISMDTTLVEDYDYYTRSGSGTTESPYEYTKIDLTQLEDLNFYYSYEDEGKQYTTNSTGNTPEGYKFGANNYQFVYKKISKANVDETGIYTVDINSKVLANTTTKEMALADGIKIPGPLTPSVTIINTTDNDVIDENGAHILINNTDTETQLTVNAEKGEEGKAASEVGSNLNGITLSYEWTDAEGNALVDTEDITYTTNTEGNVLIIEGLEDTDIDDITYQVKVTSTRNGVSTTATSLPYRVTIAPFEPIIKIHKIENNNKLVWVTQNYRSEINQILAKLRQNGTTLTVRTDAVNNDLTIKSDGFSYYWMKLKVDENDIITVDDQEQTVFQIDLETDGQVVADLNEKLLNIFTAKTGNADELIADEFGDFSEIIPAEENDVANYQTSYIATEPGIYYCLIVNNLNEHINANASPFFVVQ